MHNTGKRVEGHQQIGSFLATL